MRCLFPEKIHQADAIETVDQWFDVMNSHQELNKKKLGCGFGIHIEEQKFVLNKMLKLISNSLFGQCKSLLPFQKGIIIGIKATIQLFDSLSAQFPFRYLLTARLNQDLVENFFSRIRALGLTFNHPGPVSCKNRIRILTVTKEAEIIVKTSSVSMSLDKNNENDSNIVVARKLNTEASSLNLGQVIETDLQLSDGSPRKHGAGQYSLEDLKTEQPDEFSLTTQQVMYFI